MGLSQGTDEDDDEYICFRADDFHPKSNQRSTKGNTTPFFSSLLWHLLFLVLSLPP